MTLCEMCGSEEAVLKADVEGTELNLCKKCSKFGSVISEIKRPVEEKAKKKELRERILIEKKPEPEIVQIIVPEYAKLIREKREKLGLGQKDFAMKINEKESLIHNIETGRFEPSIKLAKKIEKFLKINLIEEYKEGKEGLQKIKSNEFTIGDFIKVKK